MATDTDQFKRDQRSKEPPSPGDGDLFCLDTPIGLGEHGYQVAEGPASRPSGT